uniref:Uncharacterized protein n=1 Tax=Anguilla anguilla TaxID=7936 RepID=A0A0E9XCK0_ANGAN
MCSLCCRKVLIASLYIDIYFQFQMRKLHYRTCVYLQKICPVNFKRKRLENGGAEGGLIRKC